METWLEVVIRQIVLYLLPVLISLTLVYFWEAYLNDNKPIHPFVPVTDRWSWLPFLASIALTRGIIIAPDRMAGNGLWPAGQRLFAHLALSMTGWVLYIFALQHAPATGLPPLHHWWAKVFMYFNLCMASLHLLPLPGFLLGELMQQTLKKHKPNSLSLSLFHCLETPVRYGWLMTLLAASGLLDLSLGKLVFPVYEALATWAVWMAHP